MIFARKINKISEFCIIISQKIFISEFWGAHALPAPPPVSYVYVWKDPECMTEEVISYQGLDWDRHD